MKPDPIFPEDTPPFAAIVGETGNEHGHVLHVGHDGDEAMRVAIVECDRYNGDGWWLVRDCGQDWARGGRWS